ncbi:MAG: ATP-dependent metallopeptidase FtsH/Yme1/Tma family protein, partial [Dissulfurimicrobium hydrothermale]
MDKDRKKLIFHAIYWIIGLIIIFGLPHLWLSLQTEVIPYGQFKDLVKQGRILKITIDQSEIKGLLYKGPAVELPDIKEKLKKLTSTDQAGDLDTLMGRRAV